MLVSLLLSTLIAFVSWLVYLFLFSLPRIDPVADRAFLAKKVVWITGASSGIGEALALYLRGYTDVKVVLSARNESALESVKSQLVASGVRDVLVLPLDLVALSSPSSSAAADAVKRVLDTFGQVDVLIHNGGMSMRGSVADTKIDVDVQVMQCNYFGAVALTKAVLPSMRARKTGHLVAMSSVQGKLPIAFRSSYAASKHAMNAFFHSLRYEADAGIAVTVLCPGYVRTNISLRALNPDGQLYGKMDAAQASGYDPLYVAGLTYSSVRQRLPEVVFADRLARAAIMLQALCPPLLTRLMLKRTKKERAKMAAQAQAE